MAETEDDRTLTLVRTLDALRDKIYRCWTEGPLLLQCFTPAPWKTIEADVDVRPGGSSRIVMQSPEGETYPNPGIYLDVVPNERLVFTDAFTSTWEPSAKPFIVADIQLEDAGDGRTNYTAIVRHWTVEDRERHKKMGFHDGWNKAADQLETVAKTL
ncbi:SRPBCC family protein [Tianweitania populi]|uniref:Activator of HSP90 ATPase n=1 Tax=Tianweitania populi TaxID=1607949 RepID=A0A8J3GJD6_9HYPH|nr:SRPBCC family protein [Tianweitania populi]GHD11768.1 activator of HSP90 ATPase [Tianweitania populi]